MRASSGTLLACLGTLSTLALAKVNCIGDVVIADSDDAREVREACEIITGDITLVGSFEDSINLDGVKKIGGNFFHEQCSWEMSPPSVCPKPSKRTISSSTLESIRGSLTVDSTSGLEALSFPGLMVVNGSLNLMSLDDLKHVDFTSLEYVARLSWNTENLKTLKMNGLKNMGEGRQGEETLQFISVGELNSVDTFYKNPIHADDDTGAIIDLDADWMPNVKDVTIGWEFMDALRINVTELDVTLGGPNTTEMEIGSIGLRQGSINLEGSSKLETLKVGSFYVNTTDPSLGPDIEHLSLPFEELGGLYLQDWKTLRSIQLPPAAEKWKSFSLQLEDCENLDLTSEYNADKEKTWYWPMSDMEDLRVTGNISNAFL
ncbi:hypothetical protein QQX98_002052 [Neonectria punicea]|uniref:Uncharacterized protein n=1 Tax=Neonectria punicea TaxID=979145 RepID=A0ABR1HK73_9HYPO